MKSEKIDGQISFWEIEVPRAKNITKVIKEVTKEAVCVTKYHNKITDHQQRAIEKHRNLSNRIVQYCGGGIGIEFKDGDTYKTLYINKLGKEEFSTLNQVPLTPMDEILEHKEDYKINDIQEKKLLQLREKYNISSYIKREGDPNIIIHVPGRAISINKLGWALEYNNCDISYKEPEVIKFEDIKIKYNLGDRVEAYHGEQKIIGEIFSEYENQDAFNITWGNKHSAFHVSKIIRKVA